MKMYTDGNEWKIRIGGEERKNEVTLIRYIDSLVHKVKR